MKTVFMRRGEVVEWLMGEGLRENHVRTLLESGAIVRLSLPGRKRALYSRAQIQRDILAKLDC